VSVTTKTSAGTLSKRAGIALSIQRNNKSTGNEISHLRLLPYFKIQQFNTTMQYNMFSPTHTLQIDLARVAPICHEHFRGGSSEAGHLKSSRHYLMQRKATRGAHIKWLILIEYNFADLVNQTKCHHVDYVQSHLVKLFISGHASCAEDRIIVRGADTHITLVFATVAPSDEASGIKYTYSVGPIAPSSTGSGFGATPSSTKGSIKLRLSTRRAARSLRIASRREGSFENSAKKHLADSFWT
jgi:hypothetical protein